MDDWAQTAADEVLANLMDRRGIKQAFYGVDEDVMEEIRATLAGIIRKTAETDQPKSGGQI